MTARAEIRRRLGSLLLLALFVGLAGAAVHATPPRRSGPAAASTGSRPPRPSPTSTSSSATWTAPRRCVRRLARMPGVEGVTLNAFVAVSPMGRGCRSSTGSRSPGSRAPGVNVGGDVGVSGRDLDPSKPDEAVLNPAMADALDAGPGDCSPRIARHPSRPCAWRTGRTSPRRMGRRSGCGWPASGASPRTSRTRQTPSSSCRLRSPRADDVWELRRPARRSGPSPGRVDEVVRSLARELPERDRHPGARTSASASRAGSTCRPPRCSRWRRGGHRGRASASLAQAVVRLVQCHADRRRRAGRPRHDQCRNGRHPRPCACCRRRSSPRPGLSWSAGCCWPAAGRSPAWPSWPSPIPGVAGPTGRGRGCSSRLRLRLVLTAAVPPVGGVTLGGRAGRAADRHELDDRPVPDDQPRRAPSPRRGRDRLGRAFGPRGGGPRGRRPSPRVTTFARSIDALLTEPDRWAADFDAVGLVGAVSPTRSSGRRPAWKGTSGSRRLPKGAGSTSSCAAQVARPDRPRRCRRRPCSARSSRGSMTARCCGRYRETCWSAST